jgi:hypothetical protein
MRSCSCRPAREADRSLRVSRRVYGARGTEWCNALEGHGDDRRRRARHRVRGESWFTEPGLHQLRCTLTTADGRQQRIDALQIVVHEDDGWHTLPSARSEWRDAPDQDERLYPLLELAKQQVLAYAPALDEFATPPLHYRQAQLLQARNLWNAGRVDPASGQAGGDSFALTPFPLDWTVKQMLRPKSARPVAL